MHFITSFIKGIHHFSFSWFLWTLCHGQISLALSHGLRYLRILVLWSILEECPSHLRLSTSSLPVVPMSTIGSILTVNLQTSSSLFSASGILSKISAKSFSNPICLWTRWCHVLSIYNYFYGSLYRLARSLLFLPSKRKKKTLFSALS